MTEPLPSQRPLGGPNTGGPNTGGPDKARGIGPAPIPGDKRSERAGGTEFQALLDKIEESARDLAEKSKSVEKPEQLAGAVDSARESLEDVLSLKDQLLEAYEQAKRQNEGRG